MVIPGHITHVTLIGTHILGVTNPQNYKCIMVTKSNNPVTIPIKKGKQKIISYITFEFHQSMQEEEKTSKQDPHSPAH